MSKVSLCNSDIGNLYFYQHNYEAALDWYNKSLDILQELASNCGLPADIRNLAYDYESVSMVYKRIGDNAKALEYGMDAITLRAKLAAEIGTSGDFEAFSKDFNWMNKFLPGWNCTDIINIYEEKIKARAEQIFKSSTMQMLDSFAHNLFYSLKHLAKICDSFFTITLELYLKLEEKIYEKANLGIIAHDYKRGLFRHFYSPTAKSANCLMDLREAIAEYLVQKGRQEEAITYYQKCIDDYLTVINTADYRDDLKIWDPVRWDAMLARDYWQVSRIYHALQNNIMRKKYQLRCFMTIREHMVGFSFTDVNGNKESSWINADSFSKLRLVDKNGRITEYDILDAIDCDGKKYLVTLPSCRVSWQNGESASHKVIIIEENDFQNKKSYVVVKDPVILAATFAVFEEIYHAEIAMYELEL